MTRTQDYKMENKKTTRWQDDLCNNRKHKQKANDEETYF